MRMLKLHKTALLLPLLLAPAFAFAEDTVIFAADETDLQAFDRMLSEQEQKKDRTSNSFGQAVKEQAELLQAERPSGPSMGSWVREQRRNKQGLSGENASPGKSGEARSAVNEKSNASNAGNNGKALGKGKKK